MPAPPLTLSLQGAERQGQIEIPQMRLTLHSSQILMACRMAQPRKPVFALNMVANNLNLGEIAEILIPLNHTGLTGLASGHFALQGTYDYQQGIRVSPLKFSGDIKAEIPNLIVPNNWDGISHGIGNGLTTIANASPPRICRCSACLLGLAGV